MIVTHESYACFSTSSFVIQNIDLIWNLERNMIFSHVIDNTEIFHHKRMLMFELHRESQNEVIYYKLMSNTHYCPLLFNIDNIYLKKHSQFNPLFIFQITILSYLVVITILMRNLLFSNEITQSLNTYQSYFYDPIYDWLEESFFKKFPCHFFFICKFFESISC
jgi:hypothetical protein